LEAPVEALGRACVGERVDVLEGVAGVGESGVRCARVVGRAGVVGRSGVVERGVSSAATSRHGGAATTSTAGR